MILIKIFLKTSFENISTSSFGILFIALLVGCNPSTNLSESKKDQSGLRSQNIWTSALSKESASELKPSPPPSHPKSQVDNGEDHEEQEDYNEEIPNDSVSNDPIPTPTPNGCSTEQNAAADGFDSEFQSKLISGLIIPNMGTYRAAPGADMGFLVANANDAAAACSAMGYELPKPDYLLGMIAWKNQVIYASNVTTGTLRVWTQLDRSSTKLLDLTTQSLVQDSCNLGLVICYISRDY